ncbi:hypothetical protein [Pectobacterium versatile]|uniref:hypothetical protein n=1 Tax=Pectobacterium versatile TaxID=2488639 RepID=UPI00102E44B1|nr:hypothetical protein [Pectobacterium versatile]TAI99838.1 hypothetical protein EG332_04340 [Pectobacterium versatile]UEQ10495.1 hypothetical protein LLE50_05120 [Pectobacterium versatile]GKX40324.1 hypothetical protein SOASR014_40630 [Pectobacterium carotovorum subsp. carotovorum]GLX46403.1 hypothetical protein Pcaca01_40710 [Pectobacterium carotovorum subsp. carotovorum]
MTIDAHYAAWLFVYALIAGYVFCSIEGNGLRSECINLLIGLLWLPIIALMISTYVAAKVLGDEGNPEG